MSATTQAAYSDPQRLITQDKRLIYAHHSRPSARKNNKTLLINKPQTWCCYDRRNNGTWLTSKSHFVSFDVGCAVDAAVSSIVNSGREKLSSLPVYRLQGQTQYWSYSHFLTTPSFKAGQGSAHTTGGNTPAVHASLNDGIVQLPGALVCFGKAVRNVRQCRCIIRCQGRICTLKKIESYIHTLDGLKPFYAGFETCFGPNTQGAGIRYQNTSPYAQGCDLS